MAARDPEREAELEGERASYLRELVTTLTDIESLVLEFDRADGVVERMRSLSRQIHTVKGTAGSLGLDLLSLAAHRMEDLLAGQPLDQSRDEKFIDRLLAQNDLLARLAAAYRDNNARILDDARSHLEIPQTRPAEALPDSQVATSFNRVLIVEPSKAALRFCVDALQDIGAPQTSVVADGYEALGLLLKEKFDAVITSLQVPLIDGQNLGAVLRAIPGPNAATPVILLTSSLSALDPAKPRPEFLVEKKLGWAEDLNLTLQKLARRQPLPQSEKKKAVLKKIMLIDDSREIHVLAQLSFRRFPEIQIIGLQDPQQALDHARKELPDLILLDVQMTPISGKEVMQSLRAAPELRQIPVAFFTGADDEHEKRELMSLGAWQIFRKPFSPKTFAECVISRFQER